MAKDDEVNRSVSDAPDEPYSVDTIFDVAAALKKVSMTDVSDRLHDLDRSELVQLIFEGVSAVGSLHTARSALAAYEYRDRDALDMD